MDDLISDFSICFVSSLYSNNTETYTDPSFSSDTVADFIIQFSLGFL